jgi:hypothetical protein
VRLLLSCTHSAGFYEGFKRCLEQLDQVARDEDMLQALITTRHLLRQIKPPDLVIDLAAVGLGTVTE